MRTLQPLHQPWLHMLEQARLMPDAQLAALVGAKCPDLPRGLGQVSSKQRSVRFVLRVQAMAQRNPIPRCLLETQRVCRSPAETAFIGSGSPTSRGNWRGHRKELSIGHVTEHAPDRLLTGTISSFEECPSCPLSF